MAFITDIDRKKLLAIGDGPAVNSQQQQGNANNGSQYNNNNKKRTM